MSEQQAGIKRELDFSSQYHLENTMPTNITTLIFTRQEKFAITDIAVLTITSTKELQPSEAKSKVTNAITQWINDTPEGKSAWSYSCTDFNIGDLSQYDESVSLNRILNQHGINNISVSVLGGSECFGFDDVLVNHHQLNENEEQL